MVNSEANKQNQINLHKNGESRKHFVRFSVEGGMRETEKCFLFESEVQASLYTFKYTELWRKGT